MRRTKAERRDRAGAIVGPVHEQLPLAATQVIAESFGLAVAAVDQGLKIPFQVGPTPLEATVAPVHLRSVAGHDARELGREQLDHRRRLAGGPQSEDSELAGHERPQPSLAILFFGRRFVAAELVLLRQLGDQLVVRSPEGRRGLALHFHRDRRTTGLAEQGGEKLGRPSLTLPVVGHQQRRECHQPWPRLALRHARRQLRAGHFTAVSTREPMTPVLGDVRLDLGQFPHLVAERGGVATAKRCPALAALARLELLDLVALAGGHERALVLRVPVGRPASSSTSVSAVVAWRAGAACSAAATSSGASCPSPADATRPVPPAARRFPPTSWRMIP